MNLLLDTHVWLWWQMAPERLSANARSSIADATTHVHFSTISSWEMALKVAAGKLQLPRPIDEMVTESVLSDSISSLPVHHEHCFELARLPMHHRDPFDRMLIAQARVEGLMIVTADTMFSRYDVPLLKA